MAANTYGRATDVPLTNKAGIAIIAGDVVVVDTSNNDAFTTDTAGGFTGTVGVAQESIASNAVGRVRISGYCALVNVNASVTRGQYGKTYTVAKQATGTASRGVGTFCQWLTGGTTPDAVIWPVDLLGSSLTNPMTAVGDIIQGSTAGAPVALAAPLAGKVLQGAGATTAVAYKYPPGYEFDYVEKTSNSSITATSAATANTLVTGAAITYDGSTIIKVEFYANSMNNPANVVLRVILVDGSTVVGELAALFGAASIYVPCNGSVRFTPTNASHTYSVRAWVDASGTGNIIAGAGGTGTSPYPMYMRITKVSGGA